MLAIVRNASVVMATVLLLHASAAAWGDTGHMVVAQIAFNRLDSTTRSRVTELAQKVHLADKTYDFVSLACWMDDIRDFPMFEPIREWHFIDKRFIVSGPATDVPPPPVNARAILEWSINKLDNPGTPETVRAYALAYVVHLTGDVHQPLHCATRYTTQHPGGDAGGNLFVLTNAPRSNLHSYWDAAGGLFNFVDVSRPLTSFGKQQLKQIAMSITTAHPENSLPNSSDLKPGDWVDESHVLARNDAYQNIFEGGTPGASYAGNTKNVCRKRLALAGYRLANVLKQVIH